MLCHGASVHISVVIDSPALSVGGVGPCGADAPPAADASDLSHVHQPSHPLLCDGNAFGLQLGMHARQKLSAPGRARRRQADASDMPTARAAAATEP